MAEYNVKLEAVEARLDPRLVGIDGKLDRLTVQLLALATTVTEAKTAAVGLHEDMGNIKWNIVFTAFAVIGVFFAMWII